MSSLEIAPCSCHVLSVRAESHARNLLGRPMKSKDFFSGNCVPYLHVGWPIRKRQVGQTACETFPVRTKGHAVKHAVIFSDCHLLLPVSYVPYFDNAIPTGRGKAFPVRTKS